MVMLLSKSPGASQLVEDTVDKRWRRLGLLVLTALGVVYGDIGTSPLYTVRECFYGRYKVDPSAVNVLGILSLIFWSLVLVISIKYLVFALRADHEGEGGILALMELVKRAIRGRLQQAMLLLGLFGAALLYGDGMITPAISVLSAVEGLEIATEVFQPFVIPITVAILVGLFVVQRFGTAGVGRVFGPIMVLWFFAIGASGAAAVAQNPSVMKAINPAHGLAFILHHGFAGFGILGVVLLAITGGEALYADIGHVGKLPIRLGWYALALPSLLLNYFGQGAAVLSRDRPAANPFYEMLPEWALYPMIALATVATVIASQAIITGAFSLTFQGFQLGYLPRLNILHTSSVEQGQIYIPKINWLLLFATVGLVLGFRRSGNLASAYGVAIATTMLITSLLLFVAMRKVFRWPLWMAATLTTAFLIIDVAFFTASMTKIMDGGWFPIIVAAIVLLLMATWRSGYKQEHRKGRNRIVKIREFLTEMSRGVEYRRVPGQAVYLTANPYGVPQSLRHNLEHNRALHDTIVIYTARFVKSPHVAAQSHLKISKACADITRVVAYYGYLENPDVPKDLAALNRNGLCLHMDKVTYFVGSKILLVGGELGMSKWRSSLYALMARNEMRVVRYFKLPPAQVFEVGMQIEV